MIEPGRLPPDADSTARLAAWLLSLREQRGVSQELLAERLGVDQSVVSRVERGQRKVTVPEFLDWGRALGLRWSELSSGLRRLWEPDRE